MGAWEIYKANDNKQAINRIRWIKASMISYRIKSTLKYQQQEAAKQFHLTSMELRTAFTSIFNHMDKDKSGSLSAIEFGKLLTTLAEHATAAQKREDPSAGNPDGSLQEGWVEYFDTNAGYKCYKQVDTGVSTRTRPVIPLGDILIDANSQIVVLKLFDQFGHFEGDGCIVRNEFLSIVLDVTSKRKKIERKQWADQSKAHTIISNIIWPLYRELQTTCTLIRMLFTQYDRARSEELNATDLYEMVSNISPEANFTPAETEAVLFSLDIDNDGRIQETELVSFIVDWLYMSPEEGKEFAEESPVHAKMVMFLSNLEHQINDMLLGNMKKLNMTVDNDSAGRFRKTKWIRNQFANMADKAKTASVAENVENAFHQTKLSQQKQLTQRQRMSADRLQSRLIRRSTTKINNAATSATQVVPLKQQLPPMFELDDMSFDVGAVDLSKLSFKEVDEEDEEVMQKQQKLETQRLANDFFGEEDEDVNDYDQKYQSDLGDRIMIDDDTINEIKLHDEKKEKHKAEQEADKQHIEQQRVVMQTQQKLETQRLAMLQKKTLENEKYVKYCKKYLYEMSQTKRFTIKKVNDMIKFMLSKDGITFDRRKMIKLFTKISLKNPEKGADAMLESSNNSITANDFREWVGFGAKTITPGISTPMAIQANSKENKKYKAYGLKALHKIMHQLVEVNSSDVLEREQVYNFFIKIQLKEARLVLNSLCDGEMAGGIPLDVFMSWCGIEK